MDFQSTALPTELSRPARAVTRWRFALQAGGRCRARTCDPYGVNVVLYPAELIAPRRPKSLADCRIARPRPCLEGRAGIGPADGYGAVVLSDAPASRKTGNPLPGLMGT